VRCSGAVLLRVGRNGGRYCTCKSTLLPAGPAWCTAWGLRALHQRGLAVRRRDEGPAAHCCPSLGTFLRAFSDAADGKSPLVPTMVAPRPRTCSRRRTPP